MEGSRHGTPCTVFSILFRNYTELQDAAYTHTEFCGYDFEHSDIEVENVGFRMEIRQ